MRQAEFLEQRAMLATYVVDTHIDTPGFYVPGELRWAIDQANTNPGSDIIEFRIVTGSTVITLGDTLDPITDSVLIDGTTQPGYLIAPIVEIDGSAIADVGFRLTSPGGGTTIKALSIYGFQYDPLDPDSGVGVFVDATSQDNAIIDSFIGTNSAGAVVGNAVAGILSKGLDTFISGNVIANNGTVVTGGSGVILDGDSGTTLEGNLIGVDATGDAASANGAHGIYARGSNSLTIGGTLTAQRNVISGNTVDGIRLEGVTGVLIAGNYIGVDASTGASAVANGGAGVRIDGVEVSIGTGTAGGRNVISGNTGEGIRITGGTVVVQGNYIGVAASGVVGAGNLLEGIRIDGGQSHLIGGLVSSQGNVIGDNAASGIRITREVSDTLVQQNLVGVGITLGGLGNGGDGLLIEEATAITVSYLNRVAYSGGAGIRLKAASGNVIGADGSRPVGEQGLDYGNAVYGNAVEGILLEAEANDNVVAANVVGRTTPNGAIVGNGAAGISVQASRRNIIGGDLSTAPADPVFGNVVAGNAVGISVANSDAVSLADGNVVKGNRIQNNLGSGVVVDDASNQTIGGTLSANANTIVLNGSHGVDVRNGSRQVTVSGNHVGTDATGVLGLGNAGFGIRILQSDGMVIGGDSVAGTGNRVVGNGSDGIVITRVDDAGFTDGSASLNAVRGNIVRANRGHGLRITSASENFIGGAGEGQGNAVVSNTADGVRIETDADGNVVYGNTLGGAATLGNGGAGLRIISSLENFIGGAGDGQGNSIARNAGAGIVIDQAVAVDLDNGNVIVGNAIAGNLSDGIVLFGSTFQTIGGEIGGDGTPGNTITGNRGSGIRLVPDTGAVPRNPDENRIRSNFIGTDASGNDLGNTGYGIDVVQGSYNVLVGNVVGRNTLAGIRIDGGGTAAVNGVGQGNRIGGPGADEGNLVIANRRGGILLENDPLSTVIAATRVESSIGAGIELRGGVDTVINAGTTVVLSTGDGILIGPQAFGGRLVEPTGTVIEGAFVGTDVTDTEGLGNQGVGVRIVSANGVTVGTGTVVANNRLAGVRIEGAVATSAAVGNVIRGTTIRGNLSHGVVITASNYQTIGGTVDGDANLVSANQLDGVLVTGGSQFVSVLANDITGNLRHGVSVVSSNDVTVGERNEITENAFDGVSLAGTTVRARITGNFIGQSEAGLELGNGRDGIAITGVNGNSILDNVVGSNLRHGVSITSAVAAAASTGNTLQANRIVDNAQHGVAVLGSRNQVIGGDAPEAANVIGGNGLDGVSIGATATQIRVVGNSIGTDKDGAAIGNGSDGIHVTKATGSLLAKNTIRFNAANGVVISGVRGTAASPTLVRSNTIVGNGTNGVLVGNSAGTLVGGAGFANVIAGNEAAGVRIANASTGASIEANFIGTDDTGTDLGNGAEGVLVVGSNGNTVRDGNVISFNDTGIRILDAAAARIALGNRIESNLVSENDGVGVEVAGGVNQVIGGVGLGNTITLNGGDGIALVSSARAASFGNVVRGNLVGTDDSRAALGNVEAGVRIVGGGRHAVDRNVISDNGGAGVSVTGSSGNTIGSAIVGAGNVIYRNDVGVVVRDSDGGTATTTRGNAIVGNTISASVGNGVTVSGSRTVATSIGAGIVNGVLTGQGNSISENGGFAVEVTAGAQQVSFQANSMYDNVAGAISLEAGTNQGRATPVVSNAEMFFPSRGEPRLAVTLSLRNVVAGQQYQLDVYASRPEDGTPSVRGSYGGRTFLGRTTVTALADGVLGPITIEVSSSGAVLGDYLTVIATNLRPPAGTSSSYSALAREIVLRGSAANSTAFAALGVSTAGSVGAKSRSATPR